MQKCMLCSFLSPCPICDHQPGHPKPDHCQECGRPVSKGAAHCRHCHGLCVVKPFVPKPKITWPDRDRLEEMVCVLGFRETGRMLGVSDNSVRKHYLKYT